ncbi:MAG TPA: hypothetical protein VNP96_09975 [Solirubrobacterales bacterium]|nr:hypothetical protein [Solirubrobacterales bacterium]
MELDEAARREAALDLLGADPGREQLKPGDDPVLAPGQAGNDPVSESSVGFGSHMTPNPTVTVHAPFI